MCRILQSPIFYTLDKLKRLLPQLKWYLPAGTETRRYRNLIFSYDYLWDIEGWSIALRLRLLFLLQNRRSLWLVNLVVAFIALISRYLQLYNIFSMTRLKSQSWNKDVVTLLFSSSFRLGSSCNRRKSVEKPHCVLETNNNKFTDEETWHALPFESY